MEINFETIPLPRIFKRCEKDCFLDPIREKLIFITPEEVVRQKIVFYLQTELGVPHEAITLEEPLSHYGIATKRRADIIVCKRRENDHSFWPMLVVECKAPGVLLGERASAQAFDYADDLQCDYVMLADGISVFCYKYILEENQYIKIEHIPKYKQMLTGEYIYQVEEPIPPRISFNDLQRYLGEYQDYDIGANTLPVKAIPILNLWECLLDVSHKMPTRKYSFFTLIEDYGVRLLSYGNASGGVFSGPYRSFLLEYGHSTEFVSIGISKYITWAKPDFEKTVLNVAIDNEKEAHHSLQLVIDDNMNVHGAQCLFYHHGRIGIGNIGSGRVSELRQFVRQEYPEIIVDNKFFLGSLLHDRLWHMDDDDVIHLIENLISYALVRDKYRSFVKMEKSNGT